MGEEKQETCSCKRKKCPRHGKCGACRAHHARTAYPAACQQKRGKRPGKDAPEGG